MKEHTISTAEEFLYITVFFFLTTNKGGVGVLATETTGMKLLEL